MAKNNILEKLSNELQCFGFLKLEQIAINHKYAIGILMKTKQEIAEKLVKEANKQLNITNQYKVCLDLLVGGVDGYYELVLIPDPVYKNMSREEWETEKAKYLLSLVKAIKNLRAIKRDNPC